MTQSKSTLGASLLEKATKIGMISIGLYIAAFAVASENTIYLISGILVGIITLIAAFSGLPPKLVLRVSKKRSQSYLSFFAVFIPLCLLSASIFIASFSILVLANDINLPWGLQLALVLEISVALLNLGVLLINGLAITRSR